MSASILLIEDDLPLAELVIDFLQSHQFSLQHIDSLAAWQSFSKQQSIDLILCDLDLPDVHGFTLYQELKSSFDCPLLFFTATGDIDSQIKGLDLGASDYLIKPVDPRILLARINAALRSNQPENDDVISIGNLHLNRTNFSSKFSGRPIQLTNHEFELLWIFARNYGVILDRDFLFKESIGRDYNGQDRTLDARISRLRKKLDDFNVPSLTIKTIWGKGYLFDYHELMNDKPAEPK